MQRALGPTAAMRVGLIRTAYVSRRVGRGIQGLQPCATHRRHDYVQRQALADAERRCLTCGERGGLGSPLVSH
jgi:hypothetical protein